LNNKLAALQNIVESGDGKPTRPSYEVFEELSKQLTTQLDALAACVKINLPPLNKQVAGKKLDPIKDEVPPPTISPASTASQDEDEDDDDDDKGEHERVWE
jgi:hypothetical protein